MIGAGVQSVPLELKWAGMSAAMRAMNPAATVEVVFDALCNMGVVWLT